MLKMKVRGFTAIVTIACALFAAAPAAQAAAAAGGIALSRSGPGPMSPHGPNAFPMPSTPTSSQPLRIFGCTGNACSCTAPSCTINPYTPLSAPKQPTTLQPYRPITCIHGACPR